MLVARREPAAAQQGAARSRREGPGASVNLKDGPDRERKGGVPERKGRLLAGHPQRKPQPA